MDSKELAINAVSLFWIRHTLPRHARRRKAPPALCSATTFQGELYVAIFETRRKPHLSAVDYADLAIIDLSKASTPEGRAELSRQICEAFTQVGFFYIVNYGYTSAQV